MILKHPLELYDTWAAEEQVTTWPWAMVIEKASIQA